MAPDKRKYNILHPVIMSFYSKSLYKDVGQNWKGVGYGYLLFLLAVCWVPIIYLMVNSMLDFKNTTFPKMIKNFPAVEIDDGQISIDAPMPHIISDPDTGEPIVIVDTSGKITDIEKTDSMVLVTKDKVITQKQGKVESYTLPSDLDYEINKGVLYTWAHHIVVWLSFFIYPLLLLGAYVYRIFQSLIYAAIGTLIFNNIIKAPIDYQAIVRLSVIAVTPAIIISTIVLLLGITFPFEWTLYFLLTMVYLIFGIRANKSEEQPIALEEPDVQEPEAPQDKLENKE